MPNARFSSLSMIWFRPFHGSPTSAFGSAPSARQRETSTASATWKNIRDSQAVQGKLEVAEESAPR